jgi:two-component system cell cycle sensor histidine kinase/response regulator CckA
MLDRCVRFSARASRFHGGRVTSTLEWRRKGEQVSEVSSRVCIRILDEYEQAGIPIESLLEGLPVSSEYIRQPSSRISWDEFTTILSRASECLGGPEALVRLGEQQTTDPSASVVRTLARNLASVRTLYHLGSRWSGPSIFRCTEAHCVDLADGRIRQTLRILPGYRDSDEFFIVVRSALAAAPRLLGLPDSHVEMERHGSAATYFIRPPPRADLVARTRRFFRRRAALPKEEQQAYQRVLEESLEETRRSTAELAGKTVRLETLNRLGRKLAEEKDPGRLAAEVCKLLVEHCGVEGVELCRATEPDGALESLHREERVHKNGTQGGLIPAAGVESVELRVGARAVGELRIYGDLPSPAHDHLRKELIPWIALALDNANAFAALQRQTRRLQHEAIERQIAEEKFREAQKMEAVGRLAGGFAHDLNNALTVIAGFAELIREQVPPDHEIQSDINAIIEEEQRSARLIKQLLAFSRSSGISLERLDLDPVLNEMERMLAQIVGAESQVEIVADLGQHTIDADRGQIEQLIVNLVVNASDAMPGGGTITLGTRHHVDPEGEWVQLWIRDTGIGMDEQTRRSMFEPFFTTKAHGEGTGLGLAAVYGIVVGREGRINVDTVPGEGTEIRMDFPPAKVREETETNSPPPNRVVGGKETILVVDDDERVRTILHRSLGAKGYAILEAAHGAEALSIARTHGGAIDLVVTDIVMPGLDGRELGRRLFELRSELRGILYVSGYAPQVVDGFGSLGERSLFLHKPFSTDAVLEAVRSLLDR